MANPIPAREYQAFVDWFKSQGFKGQWPPNIGGKSVLLPGWGDIRDSPYYKAWVSNGRPAPTIQVKEDWTKEVDPAVLAKYYPEKVKAPAAPEATAAQEAPVIETVDLSILPMVVPMSGDGFKEVWWDRATNTYYVQDALGKPVKITSDDAVRMRNLYLAASEALGETAEPSPPSIAQQQWETSKNRREWAPGVSIEQDIDTGKLYRPGSMVEVSPDIANVELQATQSVQTLKKDWTGEQLELEKEKFAWTKEQADRAQDPELQRATNELRWERDRIQLLSGLPSDDWVSRYILENQPNPYKKQPTGEVSASEQSLEDVLDFQTGNVEYQQKRLADAITSGASADTIAEFQGYATEAQKNRDATYTAWNARKTEKRDWTPQPYPNAPGWLPRYAPGQTAGRMITPQNVPTPSGQQLTQMPRSRANQLGYFADWTARMGGGRNWRDILGEAELMQPFTPRGAGGFRTSPARQWV